MKAICAVILAAGKGTRINARKKNKAMMPLAGRPMISYTVKLLKRAGINKIIVVVGFASQTVIDYLGKSYIYAFQKKRLGTAHALKCALPKIPESTKDIFVCYSDDTAFYPSSVIKRLVNIHLKNKRDMTLLTVVKDDPFGLGRIVRDRKGKIKGIIEEKNATESQKKIKEINTGCYCFKLDFLKKYLPKIKKDQLKKEYYLTDIIDLAVKDNRAIEALNATKGEYFQGVNTKEQLEEADFMMRKKLAK